MKRLLCIVVLSLINAPLLAAPPITRDEIISIAKSGVGSRYVWGGGCWDPKSRGWKGADCSGFAAKAWQVPSRSATTACGHPYSTYNFYNQSTHWTHISRNDLNKGDAMVYRANGAGHIIVYASGDKWGSAEVYEARGTAYGIVHRTKNVESKYKAIRRHDLIAPTPPPADKLAAALVSQGSDALAASGGAQHSLCPGQKFSFRFELKNTGDVTWTDVNAAEKGKAVRLGHKAGATFGLADRLSVNDTSKKQVKAGEKTTFSFSATAPTAAGVHKTEWQLVSELVAWFGPKLWLSFNVTDSPPGHGTTCQTDKLGVCKAGAMTCSQSGLKCQALAAESVEICDGKDNDCDGETDEGGVCDPGSTEPGSGLGSGPTPNNPPTDPGATNPAPRPGEQPPLLDQQPLELRGGCNLGSRSSADALPLFLLLALFFFARRRR